jgi:hypothetical protein
MRSAAQSYSVKFLEMTRIYSQDRDAFACVFEGEDEKYFAPRLNLYLGDGAWAAVNSGGKKIATELHEFILAHPEYRLFRYAFFIDRDFEHWLQNPDPATLYITNTYSIENLYTTVGVFRSILSAEFGISANGDDSEDFKSLSIAYAKVLDEFCECAKWFNYYAKAHRIMERDGTTNVKLNIRNVKVNDLAEVRIDGVTIKYDPERPELLFRDFNGHPLDQMAVQEAVATLPRTEWRAMFRGKQQLEFLRTFLSQLKIDRSAQAPRFFRARGNVKLGLSKENCISELSQYAETPSCLREFLSALSARPAPTPR